MTKVLSPSQLEHFADQGYVIVENALDPSQEIAAVLDEYDAALTEIAERMVAEGTIASTYSDLPFKERLIRISEESGDPVPQYFDFSLPQNGIKHDTPIRVGSA